MWEMKGRAYTKTLAKIQVRGIFRIRDIRRNVLPKLIEICMETPCWCSPGWAPTWRTEPKRNIYYRVLLQKREFFLRETHKHKSNTFSNTWTVQITKLPEISHFFNLHDSSLCRHVNAASRKSLEIQAYSMKKPRTLLRRKFVWKLVFSCSNASWK